MKDTILETEVFQKIFDSADDLLFIVDDGGHIVKANTAAQRLLGYTEREITGKKVWELHPPERRTEIALIVKKLLSGEMPGLPGFLTTRDGKRVPVEPKVSRTQFGGMNVLFGICREVKPETEVSPCGETAGLRDGTETKTRPKTGKILVVDDEEDLLEVTGEILSDAGYEVLTATGGEEALRMYEKFKREISLVVLDMMMPVIDGKDVFLKIKRIDPEAKILICSGYSPEGMVKNLIGEDTDAYLQKPFSSSELRRMVGKILHM